MENVTLLKLTLKRRQNNYEIKKYNNNNIQVGVSMTPLSKFFKSWKMQTQY